MQDTTAAPSPLSPDQLAAARAFAADLPLLAGDPAEIPANHRAEALERDLRRAHQVILTQRVAMLVAADALASLQQFAAQPEAAALSRIASKLRSRASAA